MSGDLKILVIDTAMNGCSVGIWCEQSGLIAGRTLLMSRGQADVLVPLVECILEEGGLTYNDLGCIAVTKGPGAFTGMRIGLATAKALGLVLEIPVIGVSTFDAILQTYLQKDDPVKSKWYGVLIETKRNDYYFRLFDQDCRACSDGGTFLSSDILEIIDGRSVVMIGDAVKRFEKDVNGAEKIFYQEVLLSSHESIATQAIKNGIDHNGVQPYYIRPPDVSFSKSPLRSISK